MQKINALKSRLSDSCMTAEEKKAVKGGGSGSFTIGGATISWSGTTVTGTYNGQTGSVNLANLTNQTEDDKRRERPGGLTSQ